VLITKHGRPVAKLVPAEESTRPFLGRLEGIIKITGDIESPVVPAEDWEASR
jgi:antitoxin (DNA-binding transcriptional repressor) of toxin-antitoxin stability system